jgi:hypothetical protein
VTVQLVDNDSLDRGRCIYCTVWASHACSVCSSMVVIALMGLRHGDRSRSREDSKVLILHRGSLLRTRSDRALPATAAMVSQCAVSRRV